MADFKEHFGSYPSFYAAQAYDSINLIASAVAKVGNTEDTDALRAAMKEADYASVRGSYTYGNNHFPVQNFYLREVVADADGNWTTQVVETVFENYQDNHAADCSM